MSSKEKDNRLNKVKQFFRSVGRGTGGNAKEERDLVGLSLESELRPETPVAQRCKTIKDLGDHFGSVNLEESSVTKLWDLTKDLIVDNKSTEHRQTTLTFYRILIQTQYKNLTLMREHFFHVIQNHEVGEDLRHRLELLIALTENGKDITHFEEKIGKFMLQWLPSIYQGNLLGQYLDMLVNLIKFNAAHLDNEIVVGIVQNACQLSSWNVQDDAIRLQCLNILELVMCYTIFPNETLPLCVMTLCRTVNYIPFCHTSWKNMKKLLGTNLGYSSLLIMCNILNDKANYNDPDLLRGAVFHINMGIFGSTHALVFSPMFSTTSSVLMSFLHALESTKLIVTYEVILSIRRVVSKYCEELPERIWDIICEILSAIAGNIAYYEKEGLRKDMTLQQNFHETIDDIEKLMHADKLQANQDLIYDLIERVSESRPEISVLNLIDYRSKKISPTKPEWLTVLNDFVCRFYRIPNTNIRVKTIHSLMQIMDASRASYEEEILQRIVIPQFSGIASEPDLMIRVVVCKALVECALHCDTKRCGELIDIMEKVLNRPFEQYALDESVCKSEDEIQDVATVVDGLIRIFVVKLYRLPSSHAIRVFNILVSHVEQHYQKPKIFEHVNLVRSKIFTWMLKARANASYHIGYPDHESGTIRFSPYLGIDSSLPIHGISGHSVPAGQEHIAINFTTISIRRACKIIVKCIEEDRDYHIFQLVIKELPQILQNKALILGNDIESLAAALCNALPDPKSPLRSFHTAKPPSEEFNALLLPAIASLVIYHQYISSDLKLRMIEAVKVVIRSNANAGICINTLSIMILEMPETLSRQLAEVLLEISKMSRTALVAIPVLEFLSILSRLPNDLFANFVPRHYMYVFAVSLSYTKPNPYDHYTVSLAHHVMTGWLLKCKMSMRKNFVMYIISGLQTDTNKLNKDHSMRNEDSSSRQRSTSLTERVSRNRDNAIATSDNHESIQAELAETCIDFLARHTFSPCSTLPKRLPAVECMLKDGPSQTWLVGHNLVTITTSGCPSPPKANGLCDRCSLLMNKSNSPFTKSDVSSPYAGGPISPEMLGTTAPTIPTETANDLQQPNRRYTKASLQYSSGTDSGTSTDLTSTSTSSSSQHQTHRQTSNSSSVSLEALSRRGSNPEPENRIESSSVFGNSLNQLSNASSSTVSSQQPTCARSCTGWAEIYIRRPTGNISWIMHIQNPIANDCIGTDLPLSDLITLFLPTMHGGVFGPDFVEESKLLSPAPLIPILSPRDPAEQERKDPRRMDAAKLAVARVRALQRQEEITSAVASGPIDIPKTSKRGKDPSGSVSDGEADEETTPFEDGRTRARNPVRRVNSSPEMSSSLRKPTGKDFNPAGLSQFIQIDPDEAAKKKIVVSSGYTKDIRVSCEAIPEEIAGSTPPSQTDSLKDEEKVQKADLTKKGLDVTSGGKESSLPPKQHSADDVTNQISVNPVTGSASATSLKIPFDLQKINTSVKPLQSTAPLSPRLLAKNAAIKVASFSSNVGGGGMGGMSDYSNNNVEMIRGRSKTISVVREVNGKSRPPLALSSFGAAKAPMNSKLGISPSFVFLQLFHNGQLQSSDPPLKVGSDNMAALTLLDLIPPFETHKFGVLYVGPGQCNNEVGILRNRHGSVRYVEFLRSIGTLVSLKDAKENNLFVNMDTNGSDGNFTYIWKDDVVQITFHVATLMPNHDNDPNCNEKKKHIGNDYVSIVYNESGEEYNLNTIKGQFNYACVVVQPLELNMNRVFVKARQEIEKFVCHPEPKIVSDRSAPLLARQLALHANLASHVSQSMRSKNPYASNWLERLRKIKHLRTKLLNDIKQKRDAGKDEPSSWW